MTTFAERQDRAHTTALAKGWWDPPKSWDEQIALYHSEVAEAFEHWRAGRAPGEIFYAEGSSKPDGIPIELADLAIRVLDSCGWYKVTYVDTFVYGCMMYPFKTATRTFPESIADLHYVIAMCMGTRVRRTALATILAYIVQLANRYEINVFHAIDLKMAYNETRTHRHGGKRI